MSISFEVHIIFCILWELPFVLPILRAIFFKANFKLELAFHASCFAIYLYVRIERTHEKRVLSTFCTAFVHFFLGSALICADGFFRNHFSQKIMCLALMMRT